MALGCDRVDLVERKAEQAVIVRVLRKLRTNCLCQFDCLIGYDRLAYGDPVDIDVAAGTAPVAVLNLPGIAARNLGGRRLAGGVDGVTALVGGGEFGREDPSARD